jgi:diacylglycerol kinase (ATP)
MKKRRALLLINSHARLGQQDLATAPLQSLGLELVLPDPDTTLTQAIYDHRDDVDLVIVGGGDGTLNRVADALVATGLPLAILPLGTANDLARTLGIPIGLPEACQVAAAGRPLRIDLGCINGKHFFNVASLGLSVEITQRLDPDLKRRWGVLAYAIAALGVGWEKLWGQATLSAEIHQGEQVTAVHTLQIAIGNGRYYGGGLAVAPGAAINDQRLDLYSWEMLPGWRWLSLLPRLRSGNYSGMATVRSLQGQAFSIYTDRPCSINTDGELTTTTPAHVWLNPQALTVLVPDD